MGDSGFKWRVDRIENPLKRLRVWTERKLKRAGDYVERKSLSTLLSIAGLFKDGTPQSVEFLKHYVEGSGEPYELKEVPSAWQDWIVKQTGGKPGVYKELSPYNAGILDLRNTLGHFEVSVIRNPDGSKTYQISDRYEFGFKRNDTKQESRHGFPVDESERRLLEKVPWPTGTYRNPGGFAERFEFKQVGKETVFYVPWQVLNDHGKPFDVKGSFARAPAP
jgi:hypothetical protein